MGKPEGNVVILHGPEDPKHTPFRKSLDQLEAFARERGVRIAVSDPLGASRLGYYAGRPQSCHGLCFMPGAHAPSMRHTHRVNACRRLVCRVSRFAASVVSSIRLRKPGSSTLPPLLSPPFFNPCVGTKVPSAERSGLRPPPRRLRRHLLRARKDLHTRWLQLA